MSKALRGSGPSKQVADMEIAVWIGCRSMQDYYLARSLTSCRFKQIQAIVCGELVTFLPSEWPWPFGIFTLTPFSYHIRKSLYFLPIHYAFVFKMDTSLLSAYLAPHL